MKLEDLDELFAGCLEKRGLHVAFEGITLRLAACALPPIVMTRPPDSKEPGWDDDIEQLSPQEKIRRDWAKAQEEGRDA